MALRFEQATPSDAQTIHTLELSIFPEDPWTPGMIAEELASPHRYYVLAYHEADRDADRGAGHEGGHDGERVAEREAGHEGGHDGERVADRDAEREGGCEGGHDGDGENEATAASTIPVGYSGISLGLDADIMTIGVVDSMRGHGIGEALMGQALDHARTHGVERIFLEVRESNHAAQHLYEKLGFDVIGRVRAYFRNPTEDAVTMRLTVLSESDVS